MKKNTFIVLLLLFQVASGFAQNTGQRKNPLPAPDKKGYGINSNQNLVDQLKHDICVDKKFSIVIYLVQDSLYALPNSPAAMARYDLAGMIAKLNATFKRICVSFEHCKTVIIPHYAVNTWTPNINGRPTVESWFTENTINIYIPEVLDGPPVDGDESAYTFALPPPAPSTVIPINAIVVTRAMILSTSFLHAVGHFFGLPHTFEEINPAGASTVIPGPPANASPPITSLEYVSRTNMQNCTDHGDGFCDTEADPYPSVAATNSFVSSTNGCVNIRGLKDGQGNFYVPPCDNIMSFYGSSRCRFSQQQYNYMAYFIMTRRLYLH